MPGKAHRIYLTGFMGSGKSTVAPVLAETLQYEFVDLDGEIERREQLSVAEIFHQRGEDYFRALERETLHVVSQKNDCVISLGGGTIANKENLGAVQSSGILIYLKAGVEDILQRLGENTDRPMLESPDGRHLRGDELRARMMELLKQREPYYNQADVTVVTNDKSTQFLVNEILGHLNKIPGQ